MCVVEDLEHLDGVPDDVIVVAVAVLQLLTHRLQRCKRERVQDLVLETLNGLLLRLRLTQNITLRSNRDDRAQTFHQLAKFEKRLFKLSLF